MKKILFLLLFISQLTFAQTDEYRLWEIFEYYPVNYFYFFQAGWTIQSEAGNLPNPEEAITWHIAGAIDLTGMSLTPADGESMAYVNGAFGEQLQDEWLISPVFTPETDDFLFFDANYAPFWMFFDYDQLEVSDDFVFNFDTPFNSMQALISTDGGRSWTTLWDASTGNYNEETIWDYLDNQWYKIKLPLEDYTGQAIQVAFRLFGRNAQSSALDHIRVGILIPEASYAIPQGFFYGGINPEGYGAPGIMLGAAYTPVVWRNTSPDATGFRWTMPNIYDSDTYESAEENPAANYIDDGFYFPTLVVHFGKSVSEPYSWASDAQGTLFNRPVFFAGGNLGESLHALDPAIPEGIGAGNYNLLNNLDVISFGTGRYLFGTNPGNQVKAIANYFEKPAQAYLLREINIAAYKFKAPAGTELTLTIHRMDAPGEIKEVLTTATWTTATAIPETNFYTIAFDRLENLVIDDAVLVELSGFAEKDGLSFGVYSETLQTGGPEGNAYVYSNVDGTDTWLPAGDLLENGGSTSLCFTLDLVYSFVAPGNFDYDFHAAPSEGDSKTFSLARYFAPDDKWQSTLPQWITSSIADRDDGTSAYTLTADALPEGIEYRSDRVILTDGRGGKAIFHVSQSDYLGSKNVHGAGHAQVIPVNGNWELRYPPELYTQVDVFSVSGKKTGSYSLSTSGHLTITTSALPHGVYIVRFSGSASEIVKTVK
jgi:hypothetical protein